MEAKRIEGKPGRTKRERIAALPKVSGHLGVRNAVDRDVILDILDSPDEAAVPDMYQVTMTEDQALWFTRIWPRGGSPFTTAQLLADTLREVMPLPRN